MMLDVAIVGAGPAGIAAAIYLKRAGLDVEMFERDQAGGLLLNANLVENYPGFPNGIFGVELVKLFTSQLELLDIQITKGNIIEISRDDIGYKLMGENEKEWQARSVILATGTTPKPLEIDGASTLEGKIFYEVKDIPKPKTGKKIGILGGGDAAFDYALNLASQGCEVDLMFRSKSPCCLPLLEERVRDNPEIRVLPETFPRSVSPDGEKALLNFEGMDIEKSRVDYVLAALGRLPEKTLLMDLHDNAKPDAEDRTTLPGLFLAGDMLRGRFRQACIAIGDGMLAAMAAEEFLKGGNTQ